MSHFKYIFLEAGILKKAHGLQKTKINESKQNKKGKITSINLSVRVNFIMILFSFANNE